MRDTGWALVALGVCLLLGAFFVTTTTHVGYMPSSIYAPTLPSDVSNLFGMHIQMALVVAGVGSILTGTITIVGDAIVAAIDRIKGASSQAVAAATVPVGASTTELAEQPDSPETDSADNEISPSAWAAMAILVVVIAAVLIWGGTDGPGVARSPSSEQNAMDAANAAVEDLQNATAEIEAASSRAPAHAPRR
jgi:hypothetical protein